MKLQTYTVPGTTWNGTPKIPWRTTYDMAAHVPVAKRIRCTRPEARRHPVLELSPERRADRARARSTTPASTSATAGRSTATAAAPASPSTTWAPAPAGSTTHSRSAGGSCRWAVDSLPRGGGMRDADEHHPEPEEIPAGAEPAPGTPVSVRAERGARMTPAEAVRDMRINGARPRQPHAARGGRAGQRDDATEGAVARRQRQRGRAGCRSTTTPGCTSRSSPTSA